MDLGRVHHVKNELSNWICPRCHNELGELNGWCEYCKAEDSILVYNPDKFFIREIRIAHITEFGDKTLTPQEELFKELFNHEKILVKDMDMLTLRAHREYLAKIAFEARAKLTAVDDEEKSRKKKAPDGKPTGFQRNLNSDEATTNAINAVKDRKKRMTGNDKIIDGLIKLGYSREDAEKKMQAGTILGRLKNIKTNGEDKTAESEEVKEEKKPLFNPFAK